MSSGRSGQWKLQDAKARFSEVVRAAEQVGAQTVTVHGREAVVVLSAQEYARLTAIAARPNLHALLSNSPLRDLEFGEPGERSPVRDVTF
jgi:antitoxin Phd